MRGRTSLAALCALAALVVALIGTGSSAGASFRDDTDWIQAKLDAGGKVVLPKLPNGECYATRGLWVSRDDTAVTSDGACIVALGPGAGRIKRADGRPIRANAVFFLDHSDIRAPVPTRVSISGLRITVPKAKHMQGVSIFGHETTLSQLTIDGSPLTDVLIGWGRAGAGEMSERIAITNSTLTGGQRDVITAFGPIGLRVEDNTLVGSRGGAGVHVRTADRGQPVLDVQVRRNRIAGNAGPGIYLDLDPSNGAPVLASGIEISDNQISGNARKAPAKTRGGIVVAGAQSDGNGQIVLRNNVLHGNRGRAVLRRPARVAPMPTKAPPTRPPSTSQAVRDDTGWLQARLDRGGGAIFLPKLPGEQCYATRGLWVSHDDTTITSDAACIVSLGPGPVRLRSVDGDPIASSAVFFVNRSSLVKPAPVRVTISNLRIVVPTGQSGMYGIAAFGHSITLSHLEIGGSPKDDIAIGGRANGNGYAADVSVLDSVLSGANRNAISAFAVIGLRIEGNTIQGVRDTPRGQPAAGIDVEPDTRSQPTLDVQIVRNTIQDNAGPGILLELEPNDGYAVIATALEISGNTIRRNARQPSPPKRAGIVLAGGQDDGAGTLILRDNVVHENGGPGLLKSRLTLVVQASGNDLSGNAAGPTN